VKLDCLLLLMARFSAWLIGYKILLILDSEHSLLKAIYASVNLIAKSVVKVRQKVKEVDSKVAPRF